MDHTLLHSKELPLDSLRFRRSKDRDYNALLDEYWSIYEARMSSVGFHVKLRPFLGDFLRLLFEEAKYRVYFYTAGTNSYGHMILDLLRLELNRLFDKQLEPKVLEAMVKEMCSHSKLIGRDDARKFDSRTAEERLREAYKLQCSRVDGNGSLGGDSTLLMKNFLKSLSNLAGDDDTIFAIIDDRSDVWLRESHPGKFEVCHNLVQIPAYYFWENPHEPVREMESFKKDILRVGREYDLDLSLLLHLRFLDRVHTTFYSVVDSKGSADIKPIIQQCIKSVFSKNDSALLQVLYQGKTLQDDDIKKTYEGHNAMKYGLKCGMFYDFSPKEGDTQCLLVRDTLSQE